MGQASMTWKERLKFLGKYVKNPSAIGAIAPSSHNLARALLKAAPVEQAPVVAEFGAGTGIVTEELLARLALNARVLVFETEPDLLQHLQGRFHDERIIWCGESAAELPRIIRDHGFQSVDRIISELPFTSLSPDERAEILRAIGDCMNPESIFATFQYTPLQGNLFRSWFKQVRIASIVWRNLPPALIYRCRG